MIKKKIIPYPLFDPDSPLLSSQANELDIFLNKPFWNWDNEKHNLDFLIDKNCCFNHIIGLPVKNDKQYPLGWTIGQGDKEFNTLLRFVPAQNDSGIDIRIFPRGDYKSIDEYGDTFKEAKNDYKLLNYYRNSSTTLSDRPAVRAIYLTTYNSSITEKAYDNKSITSKEMMVATMVPERDSIYAIAYSTKPPDFENYLPVVEKMIDSFKIND